MSPESKMTAPMLGTIMADRRKAYLF